MDEDLFFIKKTNNSINSFSSLAKALRVTEEFLTECIDIPENERYKSPRKQQLKKDGSVREVLNPCLKIRKIQSSIKSNLLESDKIIKWPSYVFGVAKKNKETGKSKDFVASASEHCACKTLLKLDIVDFFQNIGRDEVFRVFHVLYKYPVKIASALTNLCTYKGHLPQGGITSSHLSSLIFFDSEPDLVRRLKYKELTYTRYIDDISVSSKVSNYKMGVVKRIITDMLEDKNLSVNDNKTEISSNIITSSKIHGLLIHKKNPVLPSNYKKNLRAAIHQLRIVRSVANGRNNSAYRDSYRSVLGRAYYMKRLKHPKADAYLKFLKSNKTIPKISRYFVDKLEANIIFIENSFGKYEKSKDWYLHRIKSINYQIGIDAGSYEKRKNNFRDRIKKIQSML